MITLGMSGEIQNVEKIEKNRLGITHYCICFKRSMILLIDNYDSFVFNLARYIQQLGFETIVVRNNAISMEEIKNMRPSHIVISPGPKAPEQAGVSLEVIHSFFDKLPILGVCLGHQAIAHAFGGKIEKAKKPLHGKSSFVTHDQKTIFKNIKSPLKVGRYHSLIVSKENFPSDLEITAESEEGEVMALRHKIYSIFGVQFHPESVLTESGYELLKNFFG